MKSLQFIKIELDSIQNGLGLWIDSRTPDSIFDAEDDAIENNEARFQLLEGCLYDYQLNNPDYLLENPFDNIVQPHTRMPNLGIIAPNIYVGTLEIPLKEKSTGITKCHIQLEVQSIKSGYRDDYRDMLELITEKCTDLLMQAGAPVLHHFDINYLQDSQTLYQRFAFIKSVIHTDEFAEAIHRIVTLPVSKWKEIPEKINILNIKRFTNANVREIMTAANRRELPVNHHLAAQGIEALPDRVTLARKVDSVDTPENRFVKHVLEALLKFCTDINNSAVLFDHKKLENESDSLIKELESQLHHTFFKGISRPTTLKLNSPVLQRKEGYREVLRVWLIFDLAAKLIWKGGDDVYGAGKKDIAILYEYWLFFKLLDLFQNLFDIEPKDIAELIQPSADGLSLQIKQGMHTALEGVHNTSSRKIKIRFNYNRTFSGNKNYPDSGSWATSLRPDYTLSFWPFGISEEEAEKQELIVHVHFDAKYKVANLKDYLHKNSEHDLNEEKTNNRKGIYKNADLIKMHAYRDAIRRTSGAYVLYPGETSINYKGFHEIIPGLGAFPVRPSKSDSGIGELKVFILEIIEHLNNRASQREKIAFRTFDIYKTPPDLCLEVRDQLPEAYNNNRDLIPDDTYVLVGFYNSSKQYNWILSNHLYNLRMGLGQGSLVLDKEIVSSKYLLLHTKGDTSSGDLWRIKSLGPKIFSKHDMISIGYYSPSKDYYLVIELEPVFEPDFQNVKWEFKKLQNYKPRRASAYPFSCSLSELMQYKIK